MNTAHFGYKRIKASKKSAMVRSVFENIADRYDLMNDLMSGGLHRLWRAALIDQLRPRAGMHLLDVAGGTGDIACRFLLAGGKRVTICDISESMVGIGRDRLINQNIGQFVQWTVGDAENLPLPNGSVDAYTIAFGLRNATDIDAALQEARRVLRPGGRFLCLEFSRVVSPFLSDMYDQFSFSVLPFLGRTVAHDEAAYRYLAESIRRFPSQEELGRRMAAADFGQVSFRNLLGGIVAIHGAWRI